MPYLILTAHGEELDRRELKGPLTLGRSPSCDLNVHDILMSRVHCRIEPCDGGRWKLLDLASKNGTHLRWSRITEHTLVEGDWFRVSRTKMSFYAGAFIPPVAGTVRKSKLVRPADPHEALNGTVSDFVYVEAETAGEEFDAHPSPVRPAAPLPIPVASTAALAGATTAAGSASVLEEISSSWDSIVATASRPNRLARP
jgi:hypothetical protein